MNVRGRGWSLRGEFSHVASLICVKTRLAGPHACVDAERLDCMYAALVSQLQEAAGMGVHAVELRSAARAQWVFQGRKHDSGGSRAGPGRDEIAAARSVLDRMSSL